MFEYYATGSLLNLEDFNDDFSVANSCTTGNNCLLDITAGITEDK